MKTFDDNIINHTLLGNEILISPQLELPNFFLKLSVFHTYIAELSLCLSSIFMLILISHFHITTKERRNQFSKREKDVTSLDNWVPEKRTKD